MTTFEALAIFLTGFAVGCVVMVMTIAVFTGKPMKRPKATLIDLNKYRKEKYEREK